MNAVAAGQRKSLSVGPGRRHLGQRQTAILPGPTSLVLGYGLYVAARVTHARNRRGCHCVN